MNSIAWIDVWHIIIFTNTILALWTVFHRKRSVATSWAWLIVLIIFPVIGFVIYGFVGRGNFAGEPFLPSTASTTLA